MGRTGQAPAQWVRAWRPRVPGIVEILHARFVAHAYPLHTHDTWTLLIVDSGIVRYDLDRSAHGTVPAVVTLLPPHVPHDGRAGTRSGFRKRVVYLDAGLFDPAATGTAVDNPGLPDPLLRQRIDALHRSLAVPGDELEAESRLALICDRLGTHLTRDADGAAASTTAGGTAHLPASTGPRRLADELRDLLEDHVASGLTLRDAGARLGAHPAHLVRSFTAAFGLAPHRYLTGRRIDRARRLLLDGVPPAQAALAAGFYDQAHLGRHFRRYLGVGPAAYASAWPAASLVR